MARILLVDDAGYMRRLIGIMATKGGHEVVGEAETGQTAVELYEKVKPDLVILDILMPDMNGLEVTRALRQAEQKTGRHIPVIAVTAHAMEGSREECLAAGMDGFLSKPLDRERLDALLSESGVKAAA